MFHTVPKKIEAVILCHCAIFLADQPQFLVIPVRFQDKITEQCEKFFGNKCIAVVLRIIFPVLDGELSRSINKWIYHMPVPGPGPPWKKDQLKLQL